MSITLKIVNEKGETREVVLAAGEMIELQAGERIDATAASEENLELSLAGGDLIIGNGTIEILVTNFANSGGLISNGQVITAQQVVSGQFNGVEIVETIVEAEGTEISPDSQQPELVTTEFEEVDDFFDPQAEVDALNSNNDQADSSGQESDDSTGDQEGSTENNNTETNVNEVEPFSFSVNNSLTATEEQGFSYTIPETGGGLNDNIYSVTLSDGSTLPDWLSFDPTTRTLSGTPDDADLQSLNLSITVSDAQGLVSPVTVNTILNIQSVNDSPTLELDSEGNGLLGGVTIADVDAGAKVSKATVTLQDGEAGDVLSVELGESGLTAVYDNGVLTLTGEASADVYESVLATLSHSSSEGFTIGGDRTLEVVVFDEQGTASNSDTASITVEAATWELGEDALLQAAADNEGSVIGHWKPEGSSDAATMTKVTMTFMGQDYVRTLDDLTNGQYLKITIGTDNAGELPEGAPFIPNIGAFYFHADGTIELIPTDNLNFMSKGMALDASFSYTVVDGDSTTDHTFDLRATGDNDAPTLALYDNDSDDLLGGVAIADVDAESKVSKATVTLQDGEAGDVLSVELGESGLTAVYDNGVLTLTGEASADVYESVLATLSHSSSEGFTIGGDRTLEVVVFDEQGTASNSDTASITVEAATWELGEDALLQAAADNEGSVIGHWKPEGSSDAATMTKVTMTFMGQDYVRTLDDLTNGQYLKITIGSENAGELPEGAPFIPNIGAFYFHADGTIELIPTDNLNFMSKGMALDASFSYTVVDGDSTTDHTFDLRATGDNDAPTLELYDNDSDDLLGGVAIADVDAGAKVSKATVTLQDGEAGDALSVELGESGLTAVYDNGVLTLTGEASADVYESVLATLSHSSSEGFTIGGDRTLEVVVFDEQGTASNSDTASITVEAATWELGEDALLQAAADNEGSVIGHWKPEGSSDAATMTKVTMTFMGQDYVRTLDDLTNGQYLKITIGSENAGELPEGAPFIPNIGAFYFHADGTIELIPTDNLNFMSKGMALDASFSYTVVDGDSTTDHTFDLRATGDNDAPTLALYDNDSDDLLGGVTIADVDAGAKVSKATVTPSGWGSW